MKRIGFDVDGILAWFNKPYGDLCIAIEGVDRFIPGCLENPPTWNFPEVCGYSKDTVTEAWKHIKASPTFWQALPELSSMDVLRERLFYLQDNDLYFVTNRMGVHAKAQTEHWLDHHLPALHNPTVLLSDQKGLVCKALNLDAYIDDKLGNVLDVISRTWTSAADGPATRTYLLKYAYNDLPADATVSQKFAYSHVIKVDSVEEFLDLEHI